MSSNIINSIEKREIYADNAATTRITDEVFSSMLPYFQEVFQNASTAYSKGRIASKAVEDARKKVSKALNADESEIYFTSGGSEADNWAIAGVARKLKSKGKQHIITSNFEHHAVLHTVQALEKEGFEATYIKVNEYGIVNPLDVENAIKDNTAIVSIMYANNEIGTIQPIQEISEICHKHGVLFHTDAVQAVGNIPINLQELKVDLLSLSGHKINAQKGIGALYIRKGLVLPNLINGGGQEKGKRAGTENVPAIVGLGTAITLAVKNIDEKIRNVTEKRDKIIEGLLKIPQTLLNGDSKKRLPGNINISIEGIEGESLLLLLDFAGISASSGSACTSGSLEPSHVLLALGLPHETAHGSLRLSIDENISDDDINYIIKTVTEVSQKLRSMSPLWEKIRAV